MVEMGWRRSAALPGVDVVDSRFGREVLDPTVLENFLIGLYAQGESEMWHPHGVELMTPATLLVGDPGGIVRMLRRHTDETRLRTLVVSPEAMAATVGEEVLAPWRWQPTRAVRDGELVARAQRVSTAIDRGEDLLTVQTAFATLVAGVFGAGEPPPAVVDHKLRRVRDLLHEELERNLSLDELAAVAGLSKYHLVRRFAAAFGLPPHRYHLQLRLERARKLLREGRNIGDVASELAFADQSHLTRRFLGAFGVSPGRYRKHIRDA